MFAAIRDEEGCGDGGGGVEYYSGGCFWIDPKVTGKDQGRTWFATSFAVASEACFAQIQDSFLLGFTQLVLLLLA